MTYTFEDLKALFARGTAEGAHLRYSDGRDAPWELCDTMEVLGGTAEAFWLHYLPAGFDADYGRHHLLRITAWDMPDSFVAFLTDDQGRLYLYELGRYEAKAESAWKAWQAYVGQNQATLDDTRQGMRDEALGWIRAMGANR